MNPSITMDVVLMFVALNDLYVQWDYATLTETMQLSVSSMLDNIQLPWFDDGLDPFEFVEKEKLKFVTSYKLVCQLVHMLDKLNVKNKANSKLQGNSLLVMSNVYIISRLIHYI